MVSLTTSSGSIPLPPMTVQLDPRIERAAAGDRAAREAICRTLLPRVRNLVRYLVRGDADVDDMSQLALMAIVRGLSSYRGEGRFESWADRITARETLSYMKRRRATARSERALAEEQLAEPAVQSSDFLAKRRLAKALDTLAEEQRAVVVLHHIAGFSMPEAAETLGIPFETARSRMRLGLAKLRETMDNGGGEAS
jgi:RNA polymerase sigma-70 factor (ECF subfamily)